MFKVCLHVDLRVFLRKLDQLITVQHMAINGHETWIHEKWIMGK
jgi:hypothetical protein